MAERTKYLTEATLFAPAANKWAKDIGITNNNGGLLILKTNNNLSDLSDTVSARVNLGLRIGADVQPYSERLNAYANGNTPSAFSLVAMSKTTGQEWLDFLGAGTVRSITISGGSSGLVFTNGTITASGTATLSGTLSPANGGTGVTSLTSLKTALSLNNVDNTSDISKPISTSTQLALDSKFNNPIGSVSQYIRGDGSLAPFPTVTVGTVTSVTVSGGSTGLSFTNGTIVSSGTATLTGVLSLANGGTGVTTIGGIRSLLSINNVDNTSDLNKPISTATQTALDRRVRIPASLSNGSTLELPTPQAGKAIGWNSGENALVNLDASVGVPGSGSGVARTYVDIFTADGVTTNFELEVSPSYLDNLFVEIGGVPQIPGTHYTWDEITNELVITPALPIGETIVARYIDALVIDITQIGRSKIQKFIGVTDQTDFILNSNPLSQDEISVSVDGITQVPDDDFILVHPNILRFIDAPPADLVILVRYGAHRVIYDNGVNIAFSDVFTGDGVETQFTLSANPGSLEGLSITVGGIGATPIKDYSLSSGKILTFTSPPIDDVDIVVHYGAAIGGEISVNPNVDIFNGDGVETEFTLSSNPGSLDNINITVGGVAQTPGVNYIWSSNLGITFTSPPPNGETIVVRYTNAISYRDINKIVIDNFTGDGVESAFTLTKNPTHIENLDVRLDGIGQIANTSYTWDGDKTITFSEPIPDGVSIVVRYFIAMSVGYATAEDIPTGPFSGTIIPDDSNVQEALQALELAVVNSPVVNIRENVFIGDGVEDSFVLSYDPVNVVNLFVYVGGLINTVDEDYVLVDGTIILFTNPPPSGEVIIVKFFQGSVQNLSESNVDIFTGDGSQTTFILSENPGYLNNIDVTIGGVSQTPEDDYSWNGDRDLVFVEAPLNNRKIVVRYLSAVIQIPVETSQAYHNVFTGNGTTTIFTLSQDPGSISNLDVSVDGITQTPGVSYIWTSGTDLTFTEAPPSGKPIVVRYLGKVSLGDLSAVAVTTSGFTGGIIPNGSTVQQALQSLATAVRQNQVKSAEVVSASDFGVKANGVDDDTNAWNIAAAACAGKKLVFPNGTSRITGPINLVSDYFSLDGQGPASSSFFRAGDFGNTFVIRKPTPGTVLQTSLSGFSINSATRPSSGAHIFAEAVNGLRLCDLDLNDPFIAIVMAGVYDGVLDDVKAVYQEGSATGRKGLLVEAASSNYGSGICANIAFNKIKINSIWNIGSSGSPGLDTALHITAIDGLWGTDFYFGSGAAPLVKFENTVGHYVTGIKLANGWLDHSTSLLLQTIGTAAANFGDMSIDSVRMFGGNRTTGAIELLGNLKDFIMSSCQVNGTNGNLTNIGLSGDGGRIQFNGGSYRNPNASGTGGVPFRISGGSGISLNGVQIDGGGPTVSSSGIYASGGSGISVMGCGIYNCANPIGFDSGSSNYSAIGNYGSGFTSTEVSDYGTGSRIIAPNNFF